MDYDLMTMIVLWFRRVIPGRFHDTFELQTTTAEVDQQTDFQPIGFEIVDRLCQMDILQLAEAWS